MTSIERFVFLVFIVNGLAFAIGDDYFYRMTVVSLVTVGTFVIVRRDFGVMFDVVLALMLIFVAPYFIFGMPIATREVANALNYSQANFVGILLLIFGLHIWRFYRPPYRAGAFGISDVSLFKSDIVTAACVAMILAFAILMLGSGTIIERGYREVTEERYSFIEYASVLTLVGAIFARTKTAYRVLIAAALIYLTVCLLSGLRLRMISTGLVVFALMWGVEFTSRKKALLLVGGGVLFLVGLIRNVGVVAALSSSPIEIVREGLLREGALVSTYGGVLQTSNFYLFYVDSWLQADPIGRLRFFLGDVLSMFISRSALPLDWNFKGTVYKAIDVPGGGLFSAFMLAYFGFIGVFLVSMAFGRWITSTMYARSRWIFPIQILVAAYAFRGMLYDWSILFKALFLGLLAVTVALGVFFLMRQADCTIQKSKRVLRYEDEARAKRGVS